jgi:hypothetical protein
VSCLSVSVPTVRVLTVTVDGCASALCHTSSIRTPKSSTHPDGARVTGCETVPVSPRRGGRVRRLSWPDRVATRSRRGTYRPLCQPGLFRRERRGRRGRRQASGEQSNPRATTRERRVADRTAGSTGGERPHGFPSGSITPAPVGPS